MKTIIIVDIENRKQYIFDPLNTHFFLSIYF